jgi:hypothetical protein
MSRPQQRSVKNVSNRNTCATRSVKRDTGLIHAAEGYPAREGLTNSDKIEFSPKEQTN